jgi:hypothetical protein
MPNARGLETNPLALIQHLRHNLIDRYPRDSISKELLQNAEDAPASALHLGWSPGLPAACHQLLKGPALFTLNDGRFSARDAEAICQFGLNYKAVDRTSIGKFGLGLKSVFHLCEAFFYLSSTLPGDEDSADLYNSVVNPWLGTPHHGDWNEFSVADQNLLRRHLDPLLIGLDWFCLWIPLRREAHCSGTAPIHKDFPGDQPVCPPDLLAEAGAIFLADQLPLLRHVSRISVWDRWTGSISDHAPLFTASVPLTACRSRFPDPLSDSVGTSGKVAMQVRGSGSEMTYALWQNWLSHLEELAQPPRAWPQSFSLAPDGQPQPEKAEPHCAVSLTRRALDGPGRLVVSQAVFLPLRETVKVYPCEDQAEYSLKLHGCFFVDAGRGPPRVVAADEHSEESRLKAEWNRRLLEEGIYPLLIPAVAELAAAAAVSDAAIRGLTAAVQASGTFRDSQQHVCSAWQWAYRWRPGLFGWEKVPAGLKVLEIPDPGEAGPDLPGDALPRLAHLSETYILTPSGWPRLSTGPSSLWPATALETVLDADPKLPFEGSGEGWAYIRRFVEAAPPASAGPEATEALAGLIRRTFAAVRTRSLRELVDDVRLVIRQLPAKRRIRVPLPANWSEADRQAILSEPAGVVLVPAEFDPGDAPGAGRLTADEVVRLLSVLQPPTQRSKNSGPVRAVLSALQDGAASVLARCAELALWQGELVSADLVAQEVFSYTRLVQAQIEQVLFASSAQSAPAATHLASALAKRGTVVLPAETAEVLFGKGKIGSCEPPGLLAALAAAPLLAAPDQRIELLRYLLRWHPDQSQVPLWRRATRYLLHGHADSLNDTRSLRAQRSGDSSLWVQIMCHGLEHQGGQWRMVPSVLASELSDHQRKQLGVEEIDRRSALEILVEVGPKSFDWTVLMELLAELSDPPPEVIGSLAKSIWLPTAAGERRIRPCDTIDIKGLEEDIDRAVAAGGGVYSGVGGLADKIRQHPGYATLAEKCFPPRPRALTMLGELLARDSKNHIGAVPVCDENSLRRFIEALGNAPLELMPGVAWVTNAARATSRLACASHLVPKLRADLSTTRLLRILEFLADQHEKHPADRVMLQEVHGWYLKAVSLSSDFKQWLPNLRLLSRRGNWKSPQALALEAPSIDADDLLDESQGALLRGNICDPEPDWDTVLGPSVTTDPGSRAIRNLPGLRAELDKAVESLEGFFKAWIAIDDESPDVVRVVVGAFLCLLGNWPKMRELAEKYLGPQRSIERTRASIGIDPGSLSINRFYVAVRCCDGESLRIESLLGSHFQAKLESEPEDLLIGYGIKKRDVQVPEGLASVHWFQLRRIDPRQIHFARLKGLLRKTGERVLREVHHVKILEFGDVLDELSQTDQLDILVAQNLLLDSAPFYLRQLRLGNQRQIRTILKTWDAAHDRRAEEEEARASGRRAVGDARTDRLGDVKADFKDLLEKDQVLRREILDGLRTKLTEYGYSPSSILFELFQNADDAYLQQEQLEAAVGEEREATRLFVVRRSDEKLTVMHWGRRINYPASPIRGEDRGYGRDLRNMLTLSASDKEPTPGQESVTGKFGLGFKSVFAICDQPRVVSGRLGFEVVGGIYPMRLQPDEYDRMRNELATMTAHSSDGTIFELPLRPSGEVGKVIEDVLRPFREAVHVLLAFSRRIKHCRLENQDSLSEALAWTESPIGSSRNVFVGTLQPDTATRERQRKALLLHTTFGSFLVPLGVRGLERFSKDLATMWVTAPTGERLDLGFAINGSSFDLDVGRIQLNSRSEHNRELAGNLGGEFGKALMELFDAAQGEADYECFRQALNLAADCEPYHFWMSVWKLVAEQLSNRSGETSEENTRALVRHMLWGNHECGAWCLYANRPALPTALDVPGYQTLTEAKCVEHVLVGHIDRNTPLLQVVVRWESFRRKAQEGKIVSESRCWSALRALCPALGRLVGKVGFVEILQWEFDEQPTVDPGRALQLGEDLHGFLEGTPGLWEDQGELADARKVLIRARFLATDGYYHPAKQLLVATATSPEWHDEELRAAFAPAERILDPTYQGAALDFFQTCRAHMVAPLTDMAVWARQAITKDHREAVLKYLKGGEHRSRLQDELDRLGVRGTWLDTLKESRQMEQAGYNDRDRAILLASLGMLKSLQTKDEPEEFKLPKRPASDVLSEIASWWRSARGERLEIYLQQVYPSFLHGDLNSDRALPLTDNGIGTDRDVRRKWLSLFILGMMHGIGRGGKDFQHHRSFLELCHDEGWLDVFADADQLDKPGYWLAVIDDYTERQQGDFEYFHWLRQLFVGIRAVVPRLRDYVEAFRSVDNMSNLFPLDQILRPRQSEVLQRGGVDPPSLARVLGLGSCFVMRELVRGGFLNNKSNVQPHCYTPVGSVRRLLGSLTGCPNLEGDHPDSWTRSEIIHKFLFQHNIEPTFGGDFDIPLWIVSRDEGLRKQFLGDKAPRDEPDDGY